MNCKIIFAQHLPLLTKQQMLADYDTLITALTKINPHDYVRRKVNNYNQTDSIINLRKYIDTIKSTESFFWLVNKALTYCQDGHTSVMRHYAYQWIDSLDKVKWQAKASDTVAIKAYWNLYKTKLNSYKLKLPLKYIDGNYVSLVSFNYNNIKIPAKAVLKKCDGENINTYINRLTGSIEKMHWDFENKRFYSELFTQSFHKKVSDKLELEFFANGKIIKQQFKLSDTVVLDTKLLYERRPKPSVQFFDEQNILYISMPFMDKGDFYTTKIDSIAKIKNIKKNHIRHSKQPRRQRPRVASHSFTFN